MKSVLRLKGSDRGRRLHTESFFASRVKREEDVFSLLLIGTGCFVILVF